MNIPCQTDSPRCGEKFVAAKNGSPVSSQVEVHQITIVIRVVQVHEKTSGTSTIFRVSRLLIFPETRGIGRILVEVIVKPDHAVTGCFRARFTKRPSSNKVYLMNILKYFTKNNVQITIVREAFMLIRRERTLLQFLRLQKIRVIRRFEGLSFRDALGYSQPSPESQGIEGSPFHREIVPQRKILGCIRVFNVPHVQGIQHILPIQPCLSLQIHGNCTVFLSFPVIRVCS